MPYINAILCFATFATGNYWSLKAWISFHTALFRVISYRLAPFRVASHHIASSHVVLHHIASYRFTAHHIASFRVQLSCIFPLYLTSPHITSFSTESLFAWSGGGRVNSARSDSPPSCPGGMRGRRCATWGRLRLRRVGCVAAGSVGMRIGKPQQARLQCVVHAPVAARYADTHGHE